MEEQNKNNEVEVIKEQYIQVSEARIKNTIKEFKKGQPFSGILSSSFACMVSFFIAYASYYSSNSFWMWLFLVLAILSCVVFAVFGIITLVRKKIGKGTEKWFLEEIRNNHPEKISREYLGSSVEPKTIFNIINIILIIGIPTSVLLIVLGCNGWNVSDKEWSPMFWSLWIIGSIISLVFGTFINAYFAYLFFGFEDGFPDSLS